MGTYFATKHFSGRLYILYTSCIPLPKQVANKPILIVSSQANFYFLNPNTSVTTVTIVGPSGKIPIYITAFVLNGSKVLPITLAGTFQGSVTFTTPQIFYVNPGTYSISIKNGSTIFLPNYGLTATFQNWSIVGNGQLNYPNSISTCVTATGPVVVTAIYKANTEKFTVTIVPNGIPLGTTITQNGATLKSLNKTIPVYVDNKLYYVGSNGLTLTLTYGYHIIQFPSYYNVTFNYSYKGFVMPAGQINCYQFNGLSSGASKITVVSKNVIFVNESGTVYGNYNQASTYYLVITKNCFYFPPNVKLISNTTPVLGDIGGQILQVVVSGTNQVLNLGPTKNYVPEKLYFKAGTSLNINLVYIRSIQNQKIVLKIGGGMPQTYYGLLGCSSSLVIVSSPSGNSRYTAHAYYGNYGTINVNSPLCIVVKQQWAYGGVSY